jgi:hypothetical protein
MHNKLINNVLLIGHTEHEKPCSPILVQNREAQNYGQHHRRHGNLAFIHPSIHPSTNRDMTTNRVPTDEGGLAAVGSLWPRIKDPYH